MTTGLGELLPESPYVWRARRPGHTRRLVCFPHAGGGAASYSGWAALLPPGVDLVAVQLPGRQNRIAEAPFTEVAPLVNVLVHALRPVLAGPHAFFGHSCGAALAYELALALRDRGLPGPGHLFLSAQPAPGTGGVPPIHDLPEDAFRAEIVRLGGVEPEIAADPAVMDELLPLLRADFALWERHTLTAGAPLDCPITVLAGTSDPRAPRHTLAAWRDRTTGAFATRFHAGGHFYFLDAAEELVAFLGEATPALGSDGRTP
ncbi:thioesterase [Actinomadura sp. NAK00032]|uniref:thioesterase II family protein n=1 Tax=Actinomadura sp. NAK00032 TaxID=2742128 RepID=UPI001590CC34|nr:alpha/beta fold hydrolase [Actinomadura sp. NAK00032]QKW35614.1 thioesterase [Actinomadura sp. NAK00032]